MPTAFPIAAEVDGVLDAWRAHALDIVLKVMSIVMLPLLISVMTGHLVSVPRFLSIPFLLTYLPLLLAAVRPRWSLHRRAGILLSTLAIFGVVQLGMTQLTGSGRITLLALPLVATILVGTRTGWLMAACSIAIFAGVSVLIHGFGLHSWISLQAPLPVVRYETWILQGIRLAAALLPLMLLLTRFQILQRQSLIAERMALRRLEQESADRKRLEYEIARISEAERRRLGADLHDGPCQYLTATLLNCSAMEHQWMAAGLAVSPELLAIRQALEEAIGMVHDVARGLCPEDIATDTLIPALQRMCREVGSRHQIECSLQVDHNLVLTNNNQALHLFYIAGEAVANAVKHAHCTRITIRLGHENGCVLLEVRDNGCRPALTAAAAEPGLGSRIMAYRAGLIGGELQVESSGNTGTCVTCRISQPAPKP
ncbi:MAG: histidine kinase [Verrucomicrobiota bacterium]|jgi:signal transduction histidine kinase|nr:histidine kinase [Verrucomicrobiota bacterium]